MLYIHNTNSGHHFQQYILYLREYIAFALVNFMYLKFSLFNLIIFSYEIFDITFLEDIILCLVKINPTFSTYIIGCYEISVTIHIKHLKQYLVHYKPSAGYKNENICKHKWFIKVLFCSIYSEGYAKQHQWHRNNFEA